MISETLRDQVGVITGASSGIGAGVAEELSACGMKLVLNGRREGRLRELSDRLGDNLFVVGDLTDPGLPDTLITTALGHYGRCDVVFNNAGVMHSSCYKEADVDLLCSMVRVNVEAATRMAYTAMTHFQKVGCGHLVNVSSILGIEGKTEHGRLCRDQIRDRGLIRSLTNGNGKVQHQGERHRTGRRRYRATESLLGSPP